MSRMHYFTIFLGLALAFAACGVQASDSAVIPYVQVQDITTQQAQIRADVLAKRGRYAKLSDQNRDALISKQDQVLALVAGKTSTSELSAENRVAVFNLLEGIQGIINNAQSDAIVCKMEKQIGSNFPKRVCMTAQEAELQREAARQEMSRSRTCGTGQFCN